MQADFEVTGGGTVYLLRPLNETAKAHIEENTDDSAQWFGGALVVEHRYIVLLVQALRAEGFTVRG